jgi:hypothetical protein
MKGATMTSSTLLSRGALAAIFVAGSLVAPAALAQSPDRGSSVKDPARANVYVPSSQPGLPGVPRTANVYVPPVQAGLPGVPRTANVYVPPSQPGLPGVPRTANVYVPPVQAGLPGVPQRPAQTQTLAHAAVPSAGDGASPWAVIGLALGCAALLGGAGLGLVHRARRARRPVA